MFPLCRTCADTESKSPCRHGDKDGALSGTYTCHSTLKKHWSYATEFSPYIVYGLLISVCGIIRPLNRVDLQITSTPHRNKGVNLGNSAVVQKWKRHPKLHSWIRKKNTELCLVRRTCEKSLSISFWGKFGQRIDMPHTETLLSQNYITKFTNKIYVVIAALPPPMQDWSYTLYLREKK